MWFARRMLSTRTRIAAAVLATASLAACGGSDDDTADTTSTTAAAAADETTTTAASGVPGLGGLDLFVIDWNGTDTVGKNTIEAWVSTPIDKSAITRGPSEGGGEVFAARLNAGAILGGHLDEDGSVSSVFVGVDPDNEAAASIVQTAFLRHIDDESNIMEVAPVYRDVALSAEARSEFISVGEDDAFVVSVIEGAEAGDRLVAVSMSNLTDETAARERAAADQSEVLSLMSTVE
jgi:hypothetical protein